MQASDHEARIMSIEVHFTPPSAEQLTDRLVAVVDTLRATTVQTTLLAGGAQAIYPSESVAAARALGEELPDAVLCGEVDALPPEGFSFGNSPTAFAQTDVGGWTVIHATSNGTRAIHGAQGARATVIGCLRNRAAVAQALLAAGDEGAGIAIVCAGDVHGTAPSAEDSFSAGAIVRAILDAAPEAALLDGARLAVRLFESFERDPEIAFAASVHAARLRALGFEADLAYAAQLDAVPSVPRVSRDAGGRLVIAAAS